MIDTRDLPKSRDAFTLACHPCDQVAVNYHNSFGSACRTAGVHHHGQIGVLGPHNFSFHCKRNKMITIFYSM